MVTLNDEQKKQLKGAIQEISNSMLRSEAERDLVREIVKEQSAELQIPKKIITDRKSTRLNSSH